MSDSNHSKSAKKPSRISQYQFAFGLYCLGYGWAIAAAVAYFIYGQMSPFMLAVMYLMGVSFCLYGNMVWVKETIKRRHDMSQFDSQSLLTAKRSPLIHLSALACYVIPFANLWLPTYLWFKHKKPLEVSSGLYVVNFQVLISLFMMTACMLTVVAVGFIMMFFVIVIHIALTLILTLVAARQRHDIYPMDLDLLRLHVEKNTSAH